MAPTVVFVYLAMSLFYSNENSNEFQSARELSGFCVHTLTVTHHTYVTISAPRILHKNLWVYIKKITSKMTSLLMTIQSACSSIYMVYLLVLLVSISSFRIGGVSL